jgi:hypothetical protein
MTLKVYRSLIISLAIASGFTTTAAQTVTSVQGKLFRRFEHGESNARLPEIILTLMLSSKPSERQRIEIRLCTNEPLPKALVTSRTDIFFLVELLRDGYGYSLSDLLLVRSRQCVGSTEQSKSIVEIWTLPTGAGLVPGDEVVTADRYNRLSLGEEFRPEDQQYLVAVRKLVERLRADSSSFGVINGYFYEQTSPALRRRLQEIESLLRRAGIARDRYLVQSIQWNDEVADPIVEPTKPRIYVLLTREP